MSFGNVNSNGDTRTFATKSVKVANSLLLILTQFLLLPLFLCFHCSFASTVPLLPQGIEILQAAWSYSQAAPFAHSSSLCSYFLKVFFAIFHRTAKSLSRVGCLVGRGEREGEAESDSQEAAAASASEHKSPLPPLSTVWPLLQCYHAPQCQWCVCAQYLAVSFG